jgi:hypothetical protein
LQQRAPVFIVGIPRSGTTLLLRTMLRHSSFGHRRMNGTESELVELLYRFTDPNAPVPFRLMGFLCGEDLPADVRRTIVRLRWRRGLVRKLARGRAHRDPRLYRLAGEHLVVRSYLENIARLRNRRVVEKTPTHLHRVAELRLAFADARFICMHRHPVDVLSSYRRRHAFEHAPDDAWTNISVDAMAQRWASDVRTEQRLARLYPEAIVLVRYDDLVERPEDTMRRICDHIGEPFDPACLDDFEQAATSRDDPQRVVRATSKWREHVGEQDAARLERLLAEPMSELGYAPYTASAPAAVDR